MDFSKDCSSPNEVVAEKEEIDLLSTDLLSPVRIQPKTVSYARREPQIFLRVPEDMIEGSNSQPINMSILKFR